MPGLAYEIQFYRSQNKHHLLRVKYVLVMCWDCAIRAAQNIGAEDRAVINGHKVQVAFNWEEKQKVALSKDYLFCKSAHILDFVIWGDGWVGRIKAFLIETPVRWMNKFRLVWFRRFFGVTVLLVSSSRDFLLWRPIAHSRPCPAIPEVPEITERRGARLSWLLMISLINVA